MPVPGASAKPASAALPVSPEVAVTIMMLSAGVSEVLPVRAMRRGSICKATSLKALVGPWKSSSTKGWRPSSASWPTRGTRGVTSAEAKVPSYASCTHAAISSAV